MYTAAEKADIRQEVKRLCFCPCRPCKHTLYYKRGNFTFYRKPTPDEVVRPEELALSIDIDLCDAVE